MKQFKVLKMKNTNDEYFFSNLIIIFKYFQICNNLIIEKLNSKLKVNYYTSLFEIILSLKNNKLFMLKIISSLTCSQKLVIIFIILKIQSLHKLLFCFL